MSPFAPLTLELPHQGRSYRIPEATAAVGWALVTGEAMVDDATSSLVLGDAHRQMLADGVPPAFVTRATLTAIAAVAGGLELAEQTWETGTAEVEAPKPALSGLEALAPYGVGEPDPVTGLYPFYDELPPELGAVPDGQPMDWAAVERVFPVLEYSFAADLGIDLGDVWHVKSWRWFVTRVSGLLATDTLLAAQFRTQEPQPQPQPQPEADS